MAGRCIQVFSVQGFAFMSGTFSGLVDSRGRKKRGDTRRVMRWITIGTAHDLVGQGIASWVDENDPYAGVQLHSHEKPGHTLAAHQAAITIREMQINAGVLPARDEEEYEEVRTKVREWGVMLPRHATAS